MLKKKLLVGALAIGLLAPAAADAAYKSYVGYRLPPLQGNNYTSYHEKQTNDDHIQNIVENLSNTSEANFWADDGRSISKKYNQKVGSNQKIIFDTNKDKGNEVRLAMENANLSTSNAFAAGRADFR